MSLSYELAHFSWENGNFYDHFNLITFQIVNSWRTRMKRKSSKETNGETYDNDETQTDIWTLYHRPDLGEA